MNGQLPGAMGALDGPMMDQGQGMGGPQGMPGGGGGADAQLVEMLAGVLSQPGGAQMLEASMQAAMQMLQGQQAGQQPR